MPKLNGKTVKLMPQLPEGVFHLDAEESKHCIKVLRKKPGDLITITDGKGVFYKAVITNTDSRQCTFKVVETNPEIKKSFYIHIDLKKWI